MTGVLTGTRLISSRVCLRSNGSAAGLGSDRRAGSSVLLLSCGGMSYTQLRSAPDAPDTLNAREKNTQRAAPWCNRASEVMCDFLKPMFSLATVWKGVINRSLVCWSHPCLGVDFGAYLCVMKHTSRWELSSSQETCCFKCGERIEIERGSYAHGEPGNV